MCKNNLLNLECNNIQISEETKQLLKVMICYDPQERITFKELFEKFDIINFE